MSKMVAIVVIMAMGVVGGCAWADVDFGEDDGTSGSSLPQEVVSPGQDQGVTDELYQQYQSALQAAQERGDPTMAERLAAEQQGGEVPSPSPNTGASELPFPLLDVSLDRDQDGLSDGDEIRMITKPNNPDTDGDGYIDGLEVVRGYNPLQAGPGDKIEYQKPVGEADRQYRITGVRLAGGGETQVLTITGTGPNNALVAILLYGQENQLWVTRTDKTGRFLYNSADTLDLGEYTVYAAAVSPGGAPLSFSKPLKFERTHEALVKKTEPLPTPTVGEEEDEGESGVLVAGAVGLAALVGIGVLVKLWLRRRQRARSGGGQLSQT